jgi:hypothetical protein
MNDSSNDLAINIAQWIKTQGYSLEVRVANAFQKNGFGAIVSTWYTDYETKELREIDVIAEKGSEFKKNARLIRIAWHISCKTSNDKPWVVFLSEKQLRTPYFSYTCIGTSSLQEHLQAKTDISRWNDIFKDEPLLIPEKLGHGVVQAFSSIDLPYQAMMSAIKSCAYSAQSSEVIIDGKTKKKLAALWGISIPIVVINTRLFECIIDQRDREHISEVNESCVAGRKIQYGKYLAWPLVHIVTASEVDNFAQRAMSATQKIIEVLSK